MDRAHVYSAGVGSSFSVGSLAEGSEPISEAEEINEVRSLQEKGDKALKVKGYAEALKFYSDALEIDERNSDIMKTRATTHIKLKNYLLAFKDTEVLVQICPDSSQAHFLHGLVLNQMKKSKEAMEEFLTALDLDPDQVDQLTNHIAATAANLCHVTPELLKGFKDMDSYKKMSEVGVCLFSAENYSLCVKILEACQKFRTNQKGITMRVLLTLANAHSALKNEDQSIGLFQECLAIATSIHDQLYQTKALVNIASINQDLGDQNQAIVHYEKLLDLQAELREEAGDDGDLPDFWSPNLESALHLNLSVAYKMIGNMVEALNHAERYIELLEEQGVMGRQSAESYYNIGMLNVILCNYEEAIENYQKFYDQARKKGDKKAIAQAYGCLGTVYASLHNWTLSFSYHEQDVTISKALGQWRMLVHAYEMLGDTYMMKKDYQAAVEAFEAMYNACRGNDDFLDAMAFCKTANAYKAMKKYQYSLYFYEKSLALSEGAEFKLVQMTCLFKMAQIYMNSTQLSDIQLALEYFQLLITHFEGQIKKYREECCHCEPNFHEQLRDCYDGVQSVLVKLGNQRKALQYAEALHSRSITEFGCRSIAAKYAPWKHQSGLPTIEKILNCVAQQNSTVLYFSVLPRQLLLWVFCPSGEIQRFYSSKVSEEENMVEEIESLLCEARKGRNSREMMTGCENRALPRKEAFLEKLQAANEKKSKKRSTVKEADSSDEEINKSSIENTQNIGRRLYNKLLAPIEDILSELPIRSPITIVPDKCLGLCPFGNLQDFTGKYFGEKFKLFYLPNIFSMDMVTFNEQEWLKSQDQLDFQRTQSRFASASKYMTQYLLENHSAMTGTSLDASSSVNPKRIGNPRLLKSGNGRQTRLKNTSPTKEGKSFSSAESFQSVSLSRLVGFTSSEHALLNSTSHMTSNYLGSPPGLGKLLHLDSFSTVTTRTSTGTDITRSDQVITPYIQVSDRERCVVFGPPSLPEKLNLDGKFWKPGQVLSVAKGEATLVASYLDVDPIMDTEATKRRFLTEIQQAAVIHIATYGSWEDGTLVMTPDDLCELSKGYPEEKMYLVSPGDILDTPISAQLVVLSCGWSPYRTSNKHFDFKLAGTFLTAGAQCVLQTLWAVPDHTMEKFLYHFYHCFQTGCLVSSALSQAITAVRSDDRFFDPFYWAGFVLIGKDVTIDVKKIRRAMLDQKLDQVEAIVQSETEAELLNPKLSKTNAVIKEERLENLQLFFAKLLHDNHHQPDAIPHLTDLLDESLKRLHTTENNSRTTRLDVAVATSSGAMDILHVLGFHFQSKGTDVESPYVIYPHWNYQDLLVPCYDALKASVELVMNPACVQALFDLLPLPQDVISHLIDLMSITKHAPEIQLKVSDLSVRPLWQRSKVKRLLLALGFHQIGILLVFSSVPDNRRLLSSILQFLLTLSSQKSQVLLYRLDVSHLGKPAPEKSIIGNESWKLPSLGPVSLPQNQLRMSTPWMSVIESPDEMETKIRLSKRKRQVEGSFGVSLERARSWHQITLTAQAAEMLETVGKPEKKPLKVKVKPGSSASQRRVPVDEKKILNIPETKQRRDYSHFVFNQRLENIADKALTEVKNLYLPYVQAS